MKVETYLAVPLVKVLQSDLQDRCHPQTIAVCQSRAEGLGLEAIVCDEKNFDVSSDVSGVLVQYPATDGSISDYSVSPHSLDMMQHMLQ